ncbi:MAG: hypothetical protein CL840_07585 [Crocinitomicaceae bacterium]|nr:hypothetical protein [Crocinitomicaceae bacterium]|tara:strand:- start:19540 stop:20217 length:678 start_codon:yes stop_codon:yes gene_type:complete
MYKVLALSSLIVLSFSCKKDEEITENPNCEPELKVQDYMPMAVGNYWVYQQYRIDSNRVEEKMGQVDSMKITRIEKIRGNEYFVFEGTNSPYGNFDGSIIHMLRDSNGYLVNQSGDILMSVKNFTDTLDKGSDNNDIYSYYHKMRGESQVNIAGAVETVINYQVDRIFNKPFSDELGTEAVVSNNYYAKGRGKVMDDYYYMADYITNKRIIERRLIRYHIVSESK